MSALQRLTHEFACSERHLERLLADKTPPGFYRKGPRGMWRARGPLTPARISRIGRLWGLAIRPAYRAPAEAQFRRLKRSQGYRAAHAVMDYHAQVDPIGAAILGELEDAWELPLADFARKHAPQIVRAAGRDLRIVELELAVRRLVAAGNARPFRYQIATEMRCPLRSHFRRYSRHEVKQAGGRTHQRQQEQDGEEKTPLVQIAEALRAAASDAPEAIARQMGISLEEFERRFSRHLAEAYRIADEDYQAERSAPD